MKDNKELEKYLSEKLGIPSIQIGESVTYGGDEINELEIEGMAILDNDKNYIVHYAMGDNDDTGYGLITTDYDEDENKRYLPIDILKFDDNGSLVPLDNK